MSSVFSPECPPELFLLVAHYAADGIFSLLVGLDAACLHWDDELRRHMARTPGEREAYFEPFWHHEREPRLIWAYRACKHTGALARHALRALMNLAAVCRHIADIIPWRRIYAHVMLLYGARMIDGAQSVGLHSTRLLDVPDWSELPPRLFMLSLLRFFHYYRMHSYDRGELIVECDGYIERALHAGDSIRPRKRQRTDIPTHGEGKDDADIDT